jgi:prepilin-type N-terminal cleavage/methylation domain-containing protein
MTDARLSIHRPARRRRQRGFTLIEIIVALAILVVALTALFKAFSGGLRATEVTERRASAVMLARSLLDRVGVDIPLAPGTEKGVTEDGQSWTITVVPSPLIAPEHRADSPVIPFDIAVSVSVGGGHAVTLASLQLAPATAGEEGVQ